MSLVELALVAVVIEEEGSCEVGRQMPMTMSNLKFAVEEIHRDSNPMAFSSQPSKKSSTCKREGLLQG